MSASPASSSGSIKDVRIVDQRVAEVAFGRRLVHPLPATVSATLKYKNLIGQRYMALDQGAGPTGEDLPRVVRSRSSGPGPRST